ncbi:MAG TPA: S-adenosyl-l-methionine hydroxide adenosyltransferase family protein [Cyclobacteriaceae bacterium]|nr:S-adenosyl-l-methionine hydroxide adenosyltransferase family protein [Cyclobacteriaceae bacterium]
MKTYRNYPVYITLIFLLLSCNKERKILVFQSDFGLKDGAVAAMKGVSTSVSNDLQIYDLTHEIQAYNIGEAAYRLNQAASYWPAGTVFVSIVDPGVGSTRKSIVMKTRTGHYFVTPDNGTLTLIAESMGIEAVREIDETVNRLKGSSESYTFHGRDVYAYTGARLASQTITFEQVGKLLEGDIIRLPGMLPTVTSNEITGSIPVLDIQYGNVWTNIDKAALEKIGVKDSVKVSIYFDAEKKYEGTMLLGHTFSDVPVGTDVAYMNSLLNLSFGINQGSFAGKYGVSSGEGWKVVIRK